jgi:hypothetical protein
MRAAVLLPLAYLATYVPAPKAQLHNTEDHESVRLLKNCMATTRTEMIIKLQNLTIGMASEEVRDSNSTEDVV